jgi:hypothetical protein
VLGEVEPEPSLAAWQARVALTQPADGAIAAGRDGIVLSLRPTLWRATVYLNLAAGVWYAVDHDLSLELAKMPVSLIVHELVERAGVAGIAFLAVGLAARRHPQVDVVYGRKLVGSIERRVVARLCLSASKHQGQHGAGRRRHRGIDASTRSHLLPTPLLPKQGSAL